MVPPAPAALLSARQPAPRAAPRFPQRLPCNSTPQAEHHRDGCSRSPRTQAGQAAEVCRLRQSALQLAPVQQAPRGHGQAVGQIWNAAMVAPLGPALLAPGCARRQLLGRWPLSWTACLPARLPQPHRLLPGCLPSVPLHCCLPAERHRPTARPALRTRDQMQMLILLLCCR